MVMNPLGSHCYRVWAGPKPVTHSHRTNGIFKIYRSIDHHLHTSPMDPSWEIDHIHGFLELQEPAAPELVYATARALTFSFAGVEERKLSCLWSF